MNEAELTGLLCELVAMDTTSGRTDAHRALQAHVAAKLLRRNGHLKVLASAGTDTPPWTLITTGNPGPRLLFACHVDTVPVGDEDAWAAPPFQPFITDQHIYGRGTVDMKGGLAVAASALLHAAGLGKAAALLLTSDEEVGCLGAPAAAESLAGLDVQAVIIPEATNNHVVTGHRGALWLEVAATGRAAHGSTPDKGENAALKLLPVLERARTQLPLQTDHRLGAETWNLGLLHAGTAPNIVPASASATIDMRILDKGEHLVQWWASQPELEGLKTHLRLGALRTDPHNTWVSSLPAELSSAPAPYFTDASVLSQHLPGVPIVIWGPGSPDQMHAVNEHLSLKSLQTAESNFRAAVRRWQEPESSP
jgi:succinyl-diaminopimelate desuccinylase